MVEVVGVTPNLDLEKERKVWLWSPAAGSFVLFTWVYDQLLRVFLNPHHKVKCMVSTAVRSHNAVIAELQLKKMEGKASKTKQIPSSPC